MASSDAPRIDVNTTRISAGGAVHVTWTGVDLDGSLAPMKVHFDKVDHVTYWKIEPEDAPTSFWVGQFSPPVLSADDVRMGDNPNRRHGIATEGTPPFTEPAPVKFISGRQLARGDFTFVVSNMRTPINYVLFAGNLTSAVGFKVLAISPTVTLYDAASPMHIRLARTSSTDEMRVSWTSAQSDGTHAVQWGASLEESRPDPFALTELTIAKTHTYTASDLCGYPANQSGFHSPGFFHEAVLQLPTNRPTAWPLSIRYRVGSAEYGWSEERTFETPKPAGIEPYSATSGRSATIPGRPALSVIINADMGETYEDGSQYHWGEPFAVNTTVHTARLMARQPLDLVLHPGDLSYATGYESEWDRFMAQVEPLTSRVPYMTAQGNHERDFPGSGSTIGWGDSGGECGVPTQARFHMPTCPQPNTSPCVGSAAAAHSRLHLPTGGAQRRRRAAVGSADDGWYSFNQGPAHFAVMNTEMSSRFGSRQYKFFAADLAAVNRTVTPWVFFLGHRQMYADNQTQPANALGDLEPLLLKNKVDIAFWGHIHFAQRSCPMFNATCVTTKDSSLYDAPIHAIIGNAGQPLTRFSTPTARWSIYEGEEYGFSHLTLHNETMATLDYYGDAPLDQTAPLHHSVTIERLYPRV